MERALYIVLRLDERCYGLALAARTPLWDARRIVRREAGCWPSERAARAAAREALDPGLWWVSCDGFARPSLAAREPGSAGRLDTRGMPARA